MAGSASSPRCISASGTISASRAPRQAAEEVRSPARSLPFGTMAGIITLLIAATLTWYVCVGPDAVGVSRARPARRCSMPRGVTGSTVPDGPAVHRHDLLDARLGQWLHQRRLARLVLDGPRPLSAGLVRRRASELPHALPLDRASWCRSRSIFALGAPLDQVDHLLDPVGPARTTPSCHQHGDVPQQVAARHRSSAATCIRSIRCRRSCCWCCARSPTSRCSSATARSSSR